MTTLDVVHRCGFCSDDLTKIVEMVKRPEILEKDEAEDHMLVLRRIHVVAQLVGGEPELGFEADVGGGVSFLFGDCGHLLRLSFFVAR